MCPTTELSLFLTYSPRSFDHQMGAAKGRFQTGSKEKEKNKTGPFRGGQDEECSQWLAVGIDWGSGSYGQGFRAVVTAFVPGVAWA